MTIRENLLSIEEKIAQACVKSGRFRDSVRLIAVSKTKPIEMIREAFDAGQISFGENYVQEVSEKIPLLKAADWHFIGSLQSNKAKQVVGEVSFIHSVDRLKLAEEIAKHASGRSIVQEILVQVRIGGEETKQGMDPSQVPEFLASICQKPSLRLRGLMSLPPLTDDESQARRWFAELREFRDRWQAGLPRENAAIFTELSMGTSSDFEWAILEGATQVRVGTAIFGGRAS